MKIERVFVEGIELLDICEFKLHKKVNEHCEGVIAGHISDQKEEAYFRKSIIDEWVLIKGSSDIGENVNIFGGYIKNMQILKINGQKAVRISFVSGTILLDLIKKRYTFQDETETYENIVKYIISEYNNAMTICVGKSFNAIEKMVVQYEETDWGFLKRLASNIGQVIVPHAREKSIVFDWGLNENVREEKSIDVIEESRMIEGDEITYLIKTRDYIDIGARITYKGQIRYVYEAISFFEGQELVNKYALKDASDFTIKKYYNDKIIGTSLEAMVLSVERDEVAIQIIGEDAKRRRMFPYATVYSSTDGAGWYCMPEPGDRVRLYFPTNEESDAYVLNAVHMPVTGNGAIGSRSNPDEKSFKNKDGKEISLTPDRILITNNKGMSIEINDTEGISIISDKKIMIESQEDIDMISMNKNLNLVAREEISLSQNDSYINVKDDIVMSGGRIKTV